MSAAKCTCCGTRRVSQKRKVFGMCARCFRSWFPWVKERAA